MAWFYEGEDGGFEYWPDGPDEAPRVHEGDLFNTAIVGDNDRIFHRVMPVGDSESGIVCGMTPDTQLEHAGGASWRIVDDACLAEPCWDRLRISVSWKAQVFRDAEVERAFDTHRGDLDFDQVLARFYADLEARSVPFERPADPLGDPQFVDLLTATYRREPSIYA